MDISFLNPGFLLLLLGIPALWFFPRRADNLLQSVLRSLLFACVVLALARPVLLAPDKALFQVLILDRSNSIGADQHRQANVLVGRWLEGVKDREKSAVIVVKNMEQTGPDAAQADRQAGDEQLRSAVGSVISIDSSSASSLSSALAAAQRQIPQESSGVVTLISDGLSTDRRWGPVVQTFIQRGIAVHTADLGRQDNDVYPAGFKVEPTIRAGQTTHIQVPVIGTAESVQVRLLDAHGRQLAASEPVSSSGRVMVPLQFEPQEEGFLKVRAEVAVSGGADSNAANNSYEKTLAVQSPIRLLYLGERMLHGAERLQGLLGAGFKIQDGGNLDLGKTTNLKDYDLVMVDDRSVSLLPQSFQEQLTQAVRTEGLGLVFCGGRSSFGTGGYDQSTIAQALPVEFTQHTEKRDPSTALALVIDTSGSMKGPRLQMARQVARLAARRLKPHDRIGIVEFYGNKHWALPLQSAANKITIDRALGRMEATGGTELYPGIQEAYFGLKNVVTRYKHILIVSDALIESSDYEPLLRRIAKDRISVSMVAVGPPTTSALVEDIAVWGQGQYYLASDSYGLPDLVFKQPSTMKLPAYKTGSFAVDVRGGAGWWDRLDRQEFPQLSGYVETRSRRGSEVIMEIRGSEHPVLASWQYGLGRVTAFMTEPVGEGTQSWQRWNDYGRMLARILTRTADSGQLFHYEIDRADNVVTISAKSLVNDSALRPAAEAVDAQGQVLRDLRFNQKSPGIFSAVASVDPRSDLRIRAKPKNPVDTQSHRAITRLISTSNDDIAAEQQVDTANALDLAALAAATGGASLDPAQAESIAQVFDTGKAAGMLALHKLWPFCLLLALLLYLSELVYRRWPTR